MCIIYIYFFKYLKLVNQLSMKRELSSNRDSTHRFNRIEARNIESFPFQFRNATKKNIFLLHKRQS